MYAPSQPATLNPLKKTITASMLSRGSNDALTKDVEEYIINSWAEKQESNTGHTSVNGKSFVEITILV